MNMKETTTTKDPNPPQTAKMEPTGASAAELGPDGIEGSLETIKEILVGENTREILKKVTALEERMTRELASIQEHATRKIESLESFIRKEILLVRDDVQSEHSERMSALEHSSEELTRISRNLEQKLGQAGQNSTQQFKETRDQLLSQSRSLAEQILKSHKELYEEIERAVADLEARKPDRQLLSSMFVKMASALQGMPQVSPMKVADIGTKAAKKSG